MNHTLSPEEGDHYTRALLACSRHLACSKAVSSSGVSRLDQIASSLVCCCSSAPVLVVYTDIDSHALLSRLLAGAEGCGHVPRPRRNAAVSAARAKQKAYVRRKYAKYQGKKIQEDDELRSFIVGKLFEKWNPDEIAGYLKNNSNVGIYASKTAIYEWLHSEWGQQYCPLLYSKRYQRKPRKQNKTNRVMILDRTSIAERPVTALDRTEPSHCEYDSIVSSKRSGSTAALAVLNERSSRLVQATLVPNLKPEPYARVIADLAKSLKVRPFSSLIRTAPGRKVALKTSTE